MKVKIFMLSLWCVSTSMTAQNTLDSTDVFFRHLNLNEVVVTGVTGQTKLKNSSVPISLISNEKLWHTSALNIIDAIARQPGIAQITTGGGISKPVIRGLGYNRVLVISDGIRQEGQQWGDEHGIEVDGNTISSVEILKGPASLMYGSDAMAGVLVLNNEPVVPSGKIRASVASEYQTNNGLFGYSLNLGGDKQGFVWNLRYSDKMAHAYKNRYDGYVPNSQYREHALSTLLGLNRQWGFSRLRMSCYALTPGIVEGERDEDTGSLISPYGNVKTYGHGMPYQRVNHYKAVWDNSINLRSGFLKAILGYQLNNRKEFEEEEAPDHYGLYFQLHTLNYNLRYVSEEFGGWKLSGGVGGMFQRSLNKGTEYLIPAYHLFDFGMYATAEKMFGKFVFSGGLRFDRRNLHSESLMDDGKQRFNEFSRNFNGMTGSVGTVFQVSPNFNLRANLSRGFRAPNMSELASNGVHEGTVRYEIGNQGLGAEYSWQADLGMDYASKLFTVQLAFFVNRVDNYIFAHRIEDETHDDYQTYKFDAGDARLLGMEAEFDFHPVHCLHFGSSFSFVDAIQMHQPRESKYLPFTPAPRWNTEVKYEITHDGSFLNNSYIALDMECNFRKSRYYMADGTETATPGYTLLNFSAGTDLQLKGKKWASLFLSVNNLTDKAYQNHLSRLKYTEINHVTGRRGVFNMGRNVAIKLIVPLEL